MPYARLTLKEIRAISESYLEYFPGWKLIRKDTIVRENGPTAQGITFERLSGGDYRPTGYIRVLVAPEQHWGFELPQNLARFSYIKQLQHDRLRERVAEAIKNEFVPNPESPLNPVEVLKYYEKEASTSPEAYSLAPLNAYLGNEKAAKYWCSKFERLVHASRHQWQDFDLQRKAFLDQLQEWIKQGEAKEQLERVLQEEREKWGLA